MSTSTKSEAFVSHSDNKNSAPADKQVRSFFVPKRGTLYTTSGRSPMYSKAMKWARRALKEQKALRLAVCRTIPLRFVARDHVAHAAKRQTRRRAARRRATGG